MKWKVQLAGWMMALAVITSACGGSDEEELNTCDQCRKLVLITPFNEVCSGKSQTCCFCQCWLDGQKDVDQYNADTKQCSCKDPASLPACEGVYLQLSESVLTNPDPVIDSNTNYATEHCGDTPLL